MSEQTTLTETMQENHKLVKKIKFSGIIKAETGLHIGGSDTGIEIGGVDNGVIRDPITNQPYIPGSSLKGKLRSLLEKVEGVFEPVSMGDVKWGPCLDPNHVIAQVFGTTPEKLKNNKKTSNKTDESAGDTENVDALQPVTRLIVRDAHMENATELEKLKTTDLPFTEVKTEVVIDRITSAAMPRQLERVPAGAEFKYEMILNIHGSDTENGGIKERNFVELINCAIRLLQDDYLGGSGTRGSGKIMIVANPCKFKDFDTYKNGEDWQTYPKLETQNSESTKATSVSSPSDVSSEPQTPAS